MNSKHLFWILVLAITATIFISGCPQDGGEKSDCPYDCCVNDTYKPKTCAAGYECQENACVEIVEEKLDCPFECCIDGTYKPKSCAAGYECQENACVEVGDGVEAGKKVPVWSYNFDNPTTSYWLRYPSAVSSGGDYIAIGTKDGVYLFQKDENTALWSYQTEDTVHAVSISPDGSYIAASTDENVYVFQKESSTPLWRYSTTTEDLIHGIESVAFSPDGSHIAVGYAFCVYWPDAGGVLLFERDSNIPLANYQLSVSGFELVSVSPDNDYILVSESMDGNVFLLQRLETRLVPLWDYHTGDIYGLEMSSDGEYIVIGGSKENDGLILLDKEGNVLWSYDDLGRARSVSISSDGSYIAAGYPDDKLCLFQKDGSMLWSYDSSGDYDSWGTFINVSMSPDGDYIAASRPSSFYVFQKDDNTPLWKINVRSLGDSSASVYGFSSSADGEYLALVTHSGTGLDATGTLYLFTTAAPS